MSFEEKLKINKEVYVSAKKDNKYLNREVAARSNVNRIIVTKYEVNFFNKDQPNNLIKSDQKSPG
ncbi:MAG TPA: hypothetical protein DCX54_13505 [Flavobacteriales bacterium]|nr:hypothetical protein [Flavobacteriales bacterium]